MAPHSLDDLKKGFSLLESQVSSRKNELLARLAQKQSVAPEDESWLDNEANLIDEQLALDNLAKASDYNAALEQLTEPQRAAVGRMLSMVEGSKVVGGKRKRVSCHCL